MSKDNTTGEQAVFLLCEGTAWTLIYFAIQSFIAGEIWEGIFFIVLAVLFAVVGIQWPKIKPKLGSRLSRIEDLATDYRYRATVVFAAAVTIAVLFSSYIHSLRHDLDMYVMPRVVTQEQAVELRKALKASPSPTDVTVTIFSSVADRETVDYGSELFSAIVAGGWNAKFQPVNPWDPSPPTRREFYNSYLIADQGLTIHTCLVGQPVNRDPNHPTPDEILKEALLEADIDVNGPGQAPDCGKYSLDLEVGKRPVEIGRRPSILFRLGKWILNFGSPVM